MVFDLVRDFADALAALPAGHPRRRVLKLLDEAVRRDVHFIDRHPTTLFQCLWNSCWWYDAPQAAGHYDLAKRIDSSPLPWEFASRPVSTLLEQWRSRKERTTPGFVWIRSLQPPLLNLDSNQTMVLQGHRQKVYCVAYSADGGRIASGGGDQTVRVWDAATGTELVKIERYKCKVTAVALSPDGRRVASATDPDDDIDPVLVHDADTGEPLLTIWAGRVNALCFSPDSRWLATASPGHTVQVWNAAADEDPVLEITGHAGPVRDVCFAPDGRHLATASPDRTARVWDAATGAEVLQLRHPGRVRSVCYSRDGRRIATADGSVRVWDAATGVEVLHIEGGRDSPAKVSHVRVCFSPDGKRLAGLGSDQVVRVWDAVSGAELGAIRGHTDEVTAVAFSPDNRTVATASHDATVRVWDTTGGGRVLDRQGHAGPVTNVRFSPDGRWVASASDECAVRVWDARTGTEVLRHQHRPQQIQDSYRFDLGFSPDGRRLAITCRHDRVVHVWDGSNGAILALEHPDEVWEAAFSPDGRRLLTGSRDETVRVWDAADGTERARIPGRRFVDDLQFSPNGRWLTTRPLGIPHVWDAADGRELPGLAGLQDACSAPDGLRVAANTPDDVLHIWDATTGNAVVHFRTDGDRAVPLCFTADGRRLATGSEDGSVRIWDASTGAELTRVQGTWGLTRACFSADGRRLAAAAGAHTIPVWDTATGAEVVRLTHTGSLANLHLSPDGRRLAAVLKDSEWNRLWDTSGGPNEVRVWDVQTGAELLHVPDLRTIASVGFSPDGEWMAISARVPTCAPVYPLEGETSFVPKPATDRDLARAWKLSTGQWVGIHSGSRLDGAGPLAAANFPVRSLTREFDVVFEDLDTGAHAAAFAVVSAPEAHLSASPTGRTWAWYLGSYLYLLAVEGNFPGDPPRIAGYELACHADPPLRLGRNFHDFIRLDEGRTLIVLGSVWRYRTKPWQAGYLGRLVRDAARPGASLGTILEDVNRTSGRLGVDDDFATLLLLELNGARDELTVANAGAVLPWLCGPDGTVTEIGRETAGIPLNVIEDFAFETTKVGLLPGEFVFACSGEVPDAVSPAGERFGPEWLAQAIRGGARSADDLVKAIADRLPPSGGVGARPFECTMICLRQTGRA